MKTETNVATATLPTTKSPDKKNVTPIIRQLNAKKPTDVPVKKIADAAPIKKDEVVKPGATHKTIENKVEKKKLTIVPIKSMEDFKKIKVAAPSPEEINRKIAERVDSFDEEYQKLEAQAKADAIIGSALTAPVDKIEKLENKVDKHTEKAKSAKTKIEKLTKEITLPVYDDSLMEFNPADFFRIKRIVEALAKKPNLLQYLAENM